MKEKLTLQDLVDLLAKKAGLTKKEADAFFREFLALINENIFNNEPVKIKDFGTFKLTQINSRESVNVNTGEKIEIPAHHKLSFLPDKALKSLVNKPFEHFETELLNDEATFDSIEISEETPESPELEDTAIDEPDFTDKPISDEPIVEEQEKKAPDTPSFVYTYTEDTQQSGDDVITINVPSQQLIDEMTRAIENIKPTIAPQQTQNTQIEEEEEETESPVSLNVNKVQEKVGQLKDAIDSLSQVSLPSTQITDSEDTQEIPSEVEETIKTLVSKPSKKEEPVADSQQDKNKDKTEDEHLPVAEVEAIRETQDQELISSLTDNKHSDEQNEVQPLPEIVEEDEDFDSEDLEDSGYYNYNKESLWSKITHRLPIILFLLVVIIAGVYLFSKLFEQRQIYDNFSSFRSLTEIDTLPNALVEKEIPTYQEFDRDPFSPNNNNSTDGIVEEEDTLDDEAIENTLDQRISKNLSIGVVNKAKYLLDNKNDNNLQVAIPGSNTNKTEVKPQANRKSSKQSATKEEVTPGSSLRSIAGKHYGNGALWVYIYEENKDKMKGYDNLSVGQIITIPNLQKYNTSIDDPKLIEKAKELERKIFSERR